MRILCSFILPVYAEHVALCWKRFLNLTDKLRQQSWQFCGGAKDRIWKDKSSSSLGPQRFLERWPPPHICWLRERKSCTRIPRGTMQFLTHPVSSQKRTQEAVTATKVTWWFLCQRRGVCSPSLWSGWGPSSPEMAAGDGPGVLSWRMSLTLSPAMLQPQGTRGGKRLKHPDFLCS